MTTTMPTPPETPSRDPGLDRSDVLPRPHPGRALWVIFGTLLVLGGLWWGTFNIVQVIAHEERTERYTVAAEGLTGVFIDNDNGVVAVTGTDGDDVVVEAEISRGLQDTETSHGVADGLLRISGSCSRIGSPWCAVEYTIEVPRGLDVTIAAGNDRVGVTGVDGQVTVDTDNGGVDLAAISGTISVRGDNGPIEGAGLTSPVVDVETDNGRIDLAFASIPELVEAEADNGSIEVALPPADGGYDIQTETDNGSIDVQVTDDPTSPRKVRLRTNNGSITVLHAGER